MTLNEAVSLLLPLVQEASPPPGRSGINSISVQGQALGRLLVDITQGHPADYPTETRHAARVVEQAGPQAGMTALLAHLMATGPHAPDLIEIYEMLGAPHLAPSPDELRRLSQPPAASPEALAAVYQIKATLRRSKPPIWRRLLVTGDSTLGHLHHALQVAFDWDGGHLHEFTIGDVDYGEPDDEQGLFGHVTLDEGEAQLAQVVPGPRFKFRYEYDFGDSWEHDLLVEKILPRDPSGQYPVCTAGKRAAPPDDCGGLWGYYHMLEVLAAGPEGQAAPADEGLEEDEEEYATCREWLGGHWDPEACNLDAINARLAGLSRKERGRKKGK